VVVLGLVALYLLKRWPGWLLIGLAIGVAGLLAPAVARYVHWGWWRMMTFVGMITSSVLLSLAYILVLLPLAWAARIAGRAGIRRKAEGESYFTDRNHVYDKEDLKDPW